MSTVSEELLQWQAKSGDTSGCTAVIACFLDDSFLVAHIGDSRAIMCQQKPEEGILIRYHLSPRHVADVILDMHRGNTLQVSIRGSSHLVTNQYHLL